MSEHERDRALSAASVGNEARVAHGPDPFRAWLARRLCAEGASLTGEGPPSLLPTCFAVLAAECIGGVLDVAVDSERLAECIAAQQVEENGWFVPGVLRRRELTSHSATYIRMQATYFAIHALDALDRKPRHPVRFAETLCDRSYLRGWLDGGPWQNPWMHSNNIMFALTFLERRYGQTGDDDALSSLEEILDYLDERQDRTTGLWQPDDEPDSPNAVFAAYHWLPYYLWSGRRPMYVDRIIDSILSIQQTDGLFIRNGGACEDLDAVHTLVMMGLVSDHRADDVRQSLERCFWRLLRLQNGDGGFPNAAAPPVRKTRKQRSLQRLGLFALLPQRMRDHGVSGPRFWKYSGWASLSCPIGASDMWSAWFRPLALRLISDRYPQALPRWSGGRYRRIPGLGWHDADAIANSGSRLQSPQKADMNSGGADSFVGVL